MKYIREYKGIVTNSLGGRDDGYPCDKTKIYDDELSVTNDWKLGGVVYACVLADMSLVGARARLQLQKKQAIENTKDRKAKMAKYRQLKDELGID